MKGENRIPSMDYNRCTFASGG